MNEDEVGLANLVAADAGVEIPAQEPAETTPEPQAQVQTEVETQPEVPTAEPEAPSTEPGTETPEPSQTEPETPAFDWNQFLPEPLAPAPAPQPDENGQVPMDQFERHLIDKAKAELRGEEALRNGVLNQVTTAEEILPEMKTNPQVALLVRNQALAAAMSGEQPDIIRAAQAVKDIMGEARVQATNNAQASITIQKNAALESGASTRPAQGDNRGAEIADRINAGDDDAVVELLDIWSEQGVV